MKNTKVAKAKTIEHFIKNCSSSKGFQLPKKLKKGEFITDYILEHPCLFPSIIEYVGEQSKSGLLNLEEIQDEISPELIEGLLELVKIALKINED